MTRECRDSNLGFGCSFMQSYPFKFTAGQSQIIPVARKRPVNVYFCVTLGVCEVWLANPQFPITGDETQPQFIRTSQDPQFPLQLPEGAWQIKVRAGDSRDLTVVITILEAP